VRHPPTAREKEPNRLRVGGGPAGRGRPPHRQPRRPAAPLARAFGGRDAYGRLIVLTGKKERDVVQVGNGIGDCSGCSQIL